MTRINVLWALPLITPLVFVALVRLSWEMVGLPWEPNLLVACIVVGCGMFLGVVATAVVGSLHIDGISVWWNF